MHDFLQSYLLNILILQVEKNRIVYYFILDMDEDNLNIEIRKFLKKVGITSQREIENYIRKKFAEGNIKEGDSIEVSMNLSSGDGELSHSINETLKIK